MEIYIKLRVRSKLRHFGKKIIHVQLLPRAQKSCEGVADASVFPTSQMGWVSGCLSVSHPGLLTWAPWAGVASCAARGDHYARTNARRSRSGTAWRPCACGSGAWVRPSAQTATRTPATGTCTASPLEHQNIRLLSCTNQ